jgi:hypothetical protein
LGNIQSYTNFQDIRQNKKESSFNDCPSKWKLYLKHQSLIPVSLMSRMEELRKQEVLKNICQRNE